MPVGLPSIDILGRQHAKDLLRRSGEQVPHLISISNPEDGPPQEVVDHPGRTLVLEFDDYSEPGKNITLPTREDVERIVKFGAVVRPGEYLMCHCNAGISRSSAAALTVIASRYNPSGQAAIEAVSELMRIKTMIHPNKLMVSFADDLLGYKGALVAAHASTFEGGGIFIG